MPRRAIHSYSGGAAKRAAVNDRWSYDPYFGNVVFLQHYEANFPDEIGHLVSPTGAPNCQPGGRFGSTSLYLNGASGLTTPFSKDWMFGAEDFTIECFFYILGPSAQDGGGTGNRNGALLSTRQTSSPDGWDVILLGDTTTTGQGIVMEYVKNGQAANSFGVAWSLPIGLWHHVAISRRGNIAYIYINGTLAFTSGALPYLDWDSASSAMTVGYLDFNGYQRFFNGHIDEMRVTKGIGRYGPQGMIYPGSPYPNS